MRVLFSFVAMLVSFSGAFADDSASVVASVDRNQVAVGDVINFRVTVDSQNSGQISEPRFPKISGVEVINTSSGVETRSTFTNGQFLTQSSRSFNFMLVLNQAGKITIPQVEVEVGGQKLLTEPIEIEVVAGAKPRSRQGQPQADPFEQMDEMEDVFNQMMQRHFGQGRQQLNPGAEVNPKEAFMIVAQADKNEVFVGEQITANFYLYTRGQIRDIDTLKYPTLKGFWKEDLEMATRLNFEEVVLNGIPYHRALLVSYALFPIKAGKTTIDSYKAKCTVLTASSFGFGRPYQYTKVSKPIAIEVKEIPVQERPANFTGAVGEFKVSAKFEPQTGVVNQPITMRVRFEGRGNAKLIELPKLELPPSFELYDQKSTAEFLKDGTSFKDFEVLMIPRQPGVFDLEPVAVSVFNPSSKSFTTISSQALKVSVTGTAIASPAESNTGNAPSSQQDKAEAKPKLPPLATGMSSASPLKKFRLPATLFALLLMVAFLGREAWVKLRQPPRKVDLKLLLTRRLKPIRLLVDAGEWRKVGVELTNTAHIVLGRVAMQRGASVDIERLLELAPPSVRNELGSTIRDLLVRCERLSFAPEEMLQDQKSKSALDKLVLDFNKVMSRAIEMSEG